MSHHIDYKQERIPVRRLIGIVKHSCESLHSRWVQAHLKDSLIHGMKFALGARIRGAPTIKEIY